MTHFRPSQLGWILAMTLGLWAIAAQAQEFRYHYVSLDAEKVGLPPGFSFFPGGINDSVGFPGPFVTAMGRVSSRSTQTGP
jgi:hypothetical protein